MIVDFQHHFTPRELFEDDLGQRRVLQYDETTIRLINSGVLDRHPSLTIHMAHLGGGIASMLGRVRSYQDKDFWGTAGNPRHGALPYKDFDHYVGLLLKDRVPAAAATP